MPAESAPPVTRDKSVSFPRQLWRTTRPIKKANGKLLPEVFLSERAETIKQAFPLSQFAEKPPLKEILNGDTIPVIICTGDELRGKNNNNICNVLDALSLQKNVTIQPIVVNDGSTDGTKDAAEQLGAYIIDKKTSTGLLDAYRSAFQALKEIGYKGPILLTDADSAPLPTWAATMKKHAEETIPHGGEAFGRIYYYDGGKKPPFAKNFLLNVATFSRDTIYRALGATIVHGPNGIIMPDPEGKIIEVLAKIPDPDSKTPVDVYVAQTIKALELGVNFSNHPQSLAITSGRRYETRMDVIKRAFMPRKVIEQLYRKNPV